jgi:hypothetical protein
VSRAQVRPVANGWVAGAISVLFVFSAQPASAQEFGIYLKCIGEVKASGKTRPANLALALRRNSQMALIQSSDVLPAGEKLGLAITPQFYTVTFKAPVQGSVLFYDWLRGSLLVWNPALKHLHTIRMSVDRQSAALQGEMLDGAGAEIGRIKMTCVPDTNETVEEPKF